MATTLCAFPGISYAQELAPSAEYKIKAACIYKLVNYISWPPEAEKDTHEFKICVAGENPFGKVLQELAVAHSSPDLSFLVVAGDPSITNDCDLVFISSNAKELLDHYINPEEHALAVTISDIPDFARFGGMIELGLVGTQIGLIINNRVARDSGFTIDERLLRLAKFVVE